MTDLGLKKRNERFNWDAFAHVDHYTLDQVQACQKHFGLDREPTSVHLERFTKPDSFAEDEGNLVTNIGLKRIGNLLIGTASWVTLNGTGSSGNGRIGVGNATTAAVVTDTDLGAAAGSGNRQFVVFDTAVTVSNGVYTFKATHTTGLSNFAWQEWGIDGGTANGTTVTADAAATPGLINHKITSLGTKTSAASWVFTVTITLA